MLGMVYTSMELVGNLNPDSIKEYIKSFGIFAPIIYIVMFTVVPLTLFPDAMIAITGGMIFGMYYGTIFTIIGAVTGATLSFFIARYLGREIVEKLIKGKASYFENGIEKNGFLLILILRLIPLVPFDIISYGSGLSKIKYKDFILATAIGVIPGVLVYINLGDKALDIRSPQFFIAVGFLIALFLFSYFMKKKVNLNKFQKNLIEKSDINI